MPFTAAELSLIGFEVPEDYTSHDWSFPGGPRVCRKCGVRELLWDDLDYPFDPCPRTDKRDPEHESRVRDEWLRAFDKRAEEHETEYAEEKQ